MKLVSVFLLIALVFLTTACPSGNRTSNLDELQDNNMNFPNLSRYQFENINFMKPDMFQKDYSEEYIISDIHETFVAYDIYVYLAVELFTASKIDVIQYSFDEEIDGLNAVHDNYVIKRVNSLYNSTISIKKELPKTIGYKGYSQVIHGSIYDDNDNLTSYFLVTLEVNDEVYVFQMIGKEKNMGYLYGDFMSIISSIRF